MLEVQIFKKRRDFDVDVAFSVEPGSAVGLFGGSGSGKSTILACVAGFEDPDEGRIRLGGQQLFAPSCPLHQRPIGFLSQADHLFGHLTVARNVRFGLPRVPTAGQEEWISELRCRLGLVQVWNAGVSRISGGQARRVALARMLARRPPLVLLDEPFAGLDRHVVHELTDALATWHKRLGFTMLVVDHHPKVLERLTTRVLAIEEGRLVQDDTWQGLSLKPGTAHLKRLLL